MNRPPALSHEDARALVAGLLDLAIDKQKGRVSNALVAAAVGIPGRESHVREWRDADGAKSLTVARLLQLLVRMPHVGLALVDALVSTAEGLREEEPSVPVEAASGVALRTLCASVGAIGESLADGRVSDEEREVLAADLSNAKRVIDRTLVALARGNAPGGDA